ncbi:MAG: MBL fold metallo-hydrolase [Hyphomicrobiaceae bacterium]
MTDDHNQLSRRKLLLGTAGLVAGTSALHVVETGPAAAKAPMSGAGMTAYRRVKLGNFEVTTVFDGFVNLPKVHPIFGQNQSAETVADYMQQNHLPGKAMQIGFTPVVVNTGNELVLFDSGNGLGRGDTRGHLAKSLAAAGFTPEQIDIVVITHYHPDHIGGLMGASKPTFPNARYVTGEGENNFWTSKTVTESTDKQMMGRSKLVQSQVVPVAAKTSFIKGGQDVVTGITAIDAFGHTPGHMAFNIESNGKRLLLWGDACNHYVASLQKPEWHVVFDMDKDAAVASRKKILDMAAADKVPATGYHMPFPAIGYVEQVGDAHRWVPLTYQLDI